jgi:putative heme-binding domain-containing protein
LPNLWTQCWKVGLDPDAALPQRVAALRLVVHDREHHAAYGARCQELLSPQSPTEIQLLAVTILSQSLTERTAAHLLANWSSALPPVRAAIVDQLLRERSATLELLDQVEKGSVAQLDLDAVRRDRLLHHRDAAIARRAAQVFQHAVNPQRAVVLERYQAAPTADADVARGQRLFEKHCAVCHTSTPEAAAMGPELKSLSDRSDTNLAAAILDPSRAVEPQYLGYHLELKSGEVVYGLIVGQSGHTLQVRQLDGKTRELPRSAIDVLTSSQRSFMPEGFEAELSPQDLADVIRYVQQL